jgi:hypothetical protein
VTRVKFWAALATTWLGFALNPLAASAQTIGSLSLPVHGNWCGLGHGAIQWPRPPLDQLDESCMRHDICTMQRGRFDCTCDLMFMQDLRRQNLPGGLGEKARAVHDAIAMMPCTDPTGQALKQEILTTDWLNAVLSGREAPWELFLRWGRLGLDTMDRTMRSELYGW